ncbi:hypothetical protein Q3G72_023236 [Acer saccharum]|nr:hypothetical protein Q3G72_023236 [Acer saccharum]
MSDKETPTYGPWLLVSYGRQNNRGSKVKNGRFGNGNASGSESFGSTGKHTRNGIVNDRKVDNGSTALVEGKTDHVKHINGSKNARGYVSKLKKSSGSRFDILSKEVDTVMAKEGGKSSNKEVGNIKNKGKDVLLELHKDVTDFEGQTATMSGDSMCQNTKTPSMPSPIRDRFDMVAFELEKVMVVISE